MEAPGWFLDEAAAAGPEHLDRTYVASYDGKAGVDPRPDLELLLDLGLGRSSTLVDMGAGTGMLSVAAAPHCARVVAVDVSDAMLEMVRARAAEAEVANVVCRREGFLSYSHQGPPADFVYSRNALHHLPDFWKVVALERVASCMRSGGVLRLRDLIFSFSPADTAARIDAWLSAAPSAPEQGWTRAELETHLRTEHSTYTWLLEPMLERAGFDILEASYSDTGIYAAYTCSRL